MSEEISNPLLELVKAQAERPSNLREYHPLRGVSDRWLYGETARIFLLTSCMR